MLPVVMVNIIDFNIPTIRASLNPNITRVMSITILDNPNFAPGAIKGTGIKDSIRLKANPIETNNDKKINLLISFIVPPLMAYIV